MLIMDPLIIVHNWSLNHLHLIAGYWCVTSTMKFAMRFLYPAIMASRRSIYDEHKHALTFLNYSFLGLLVPLGRETLLFFQYSLCLIYVEHFILYNLSLS